MNFLRNLILSFLLVVAGSSALMGQFLNWEYTNLVQDTSQLGVNPQSVQDANGHLHITYWHPTDNQLVYGINTNGAWSWERPDTGTEGGYVSDLCVDAQGHVHVAYLARNVSGQAYLKYAKKSDNAWTTTTLYTDSLLGVYGPDPDFRSFLHLSVSVQIGPDGEPIIAVFDGTVPSFITCVYSSISVNYSPSGKYDLSLRMMHRKSSGQWEAFSPNLPAILSCLARGDRFGEFCRILPTAGDSILVLASALHNHQLLLLQFDADSLHKWRSFTLDAATRFPIPANLEHTAYFEGYGYTAYAMQGDSILHTIATYADHYNSPFSNRNKLIYTQTHLDSTHSATYAPLVKDLGPGGNYLMAFPSVAVLAPDSLRVTYFNSERNRIELGSSNDGGLTWTYSPVVNTLIDASAQLHAMADSLVLVYYDLSKNALYQAALARSGAGAWAIRPITLTQASGRYLSSRVERTSAGDSVFLASVESYEQQLWFQAGLSSQTRQRVDSAGANVREHSLARLANGAHAIAYATHTPGQLRYAVQNGTDWTIEVVDPVATIRRVSLCVTGDTAHILYYETGLQGLKHAWKVPGQSWVVQIADSVGSKVGDYLTVQTDRGRIFASYVDKEQQTLKLAIWTSGAGWSTEIVSASQSPTIHALAIDSSGQPRLTWLGSADGVLRYAEKTTNGIWTATPLPLQNGFQTEPIRMVIDPRQRPWLFFNLTTSTDDIKILRRDEAGKWQQVGINSNTAEIANTFDVHLLDTDLYIIGRQNNRQATGIGMLFAPEGITTLFDANALAAAVGIAPNPSTGDATLSLTLPFSSPATVEISNLMGQILTTTSFEAIAGEATQVTLARPQYSGYYFCKLSCGGLEVVKKWVVLD